MEPGGKADREDTRMLERLLFFTDAVFAIVLTLLVLELRPPEHLSSQPLAASLGAMSDRFVAFAMSFALVAVFWAAHLSTLRKLKDFDWPTAWLNLLFLFPVCLMPFVSALVGQTRFGPGAWVLYSSIIVAASAVMLTLWLVMTRDGGRRIGGAGLRERAYRAVRAAAPGVGFSLGLTLMALGYGRLSVYCWLWIPVQLVLAQVLFGPRREGSAP